MKYGALLGWGIVIYAVNALAWSGMVLYGWSAGILPRAVQFLVLLIVCMVAGRSLRFRSWKDILPYSLTWAIVVALLDGVFTYPSQAFGIYSQWSAWTGYALVALLPLIAPLVRHEPQVTRTWET